MIEIKNLTKKYGAKTALEDVNLTIPRGQIIGLFGENGAGKTTLMKCILGYITHKGEITLDGEKITHKNIAKISFATTENSLFPTLTPNEHRSFYKEHFEKFSDKRFDGLMDFFKLPKNKAVKHFSKGQRDQLEVILSLSQGAEYIFMDEPFTGNDIFNREDFYKVLLGILEPDETVMLSTHLIDEVSPFISRAVLIKGGKIIADFETEALEEEGKTLVEFIKESYSYQSDRVSRALDSMTEGEE